MLLLTQFPGGEVRVSAVQPRNAADAFKDDLGGVRPDSSGEEDSVCQSRDRAEIGTDSTGVLPPLDSSSKLDNSYSLRINRRTFSLYMRRQIRRAGAVIEECDTDHNATVFFTATVPGSSDAAIRAFRDNAAYAISRFKMFVNNPVPSKWDFYCWELQRRGMLHLHYVVYCHTKEKAELIASLMKGWWINVLNAICVNSGVDIYERSDGGTWRGREDIVQCRAEIVKKSVSAYVSKYCSKSCVSKSNSFPTELYPTRWAGVSRPLVAAIRERTQVIRLVTSGIRSSLKMLERLKADLESSSRWFVNYCHKYGLGQTWVGYFDRGELDPLWKKLMSGQIGMQSQEMTMLSALVNELLSRYKRLGLRLTNSQELPVKLVSGGTCVIDRFKSLPHATSFRMRVALVVSCTELLPLQSLSKCMAEGPWLELRDYVQDFYRTVGVARFDSQGNLVNPDAVDATYRVVRRARMSRTTREMTVEPPIESLPGIAIGSTQGGEFDYQQLNLLK